MHESILRTLAYHAALGYAPTRIQLVLALDVGADGSVKALSGEDVLVALDEMIAKGEAVERNGRVALAQYSNQIQNGRDKEIFFPRKLRRARRAAIFLKLLPWVRGVCLCNTTALGQAQDGGDLDFFVVARDGAVWRTRFFAAAPLAALGMRPGAGVVDPVCLSFFATDKALDLSPLMLEGDDPYFRHWFLSLLPLADDGALDELWDANRHWVAKRHPLAQKWMALDGSEIGNRKSAGRLGAKDSNQNSWLERQLEKIQRRKFPQAIRDMANVDTRVVINDGVLKFHVEDRRGIFKDRFYAICNDLGVEP